MGSRWKELLWLIVNMIIIFYFSCAHYTIDKDAVIPFFYLMFLLTFPIGSSLPYIYIFMVWLFPVYPKQEELFIIDIIIPGIGFALLGYLQWFVLVPKLRNYMNSSKKDIEK